MKRTGWQLLGRARSGEEAVSLMRRHGFAFVRLMPKRRGGFTVFGWVEAS